MNGSLCSKSLDFNMSRKVVIHTWVSSIHISRPILLKSSVYPMTRLLTSDEECGVAPCPTDPPSVSRVAECHELNS